MTEPIYSYPSVWALGHKAIEAIFDGPVLVEEKIDGSQLSFGRIDGVLRMRSKGRQINIDDPDGMFQRAVEVVRELPLRDGWIYRGEYLGKPKHNTISYDRIPLNHIALFDVCTGVETYLSDSEKTDAAAAIGVDVVPVLWRGTVTSFDQLKQLLELDSFLGGAKIEGFVVKNYALWTPEKKVALGKYVSEAFKEKHSKDWRQRNPNRGDVIEKLVADYKVEARWRKAVQHLRERGELEGSPRDIGPLLKEVSADILKEEKDEIADVLFRHFWKQIAKGVTAGVPDWYKQQLAESAFEEAS